MVVKLTREGEDVRPCMRSERVTEVHPVVEGETDAGAAQVPNPSNGGGGNGWRRISKSSIALWATEEKKN